MQKKRLKEIRESEKKSHIETYTNNELYENGSWLQKPIKTILELIPFFESYERLNILDLGAGVGRNCIPFAVAYQDISCRIECVDILDLAIERLESNAKKYGVDSSINGILKPLEEYVISEDSYDLIMAISALEHIDSETSFFEKLHEICKGIRRDGIVCLVMNSNVVEKVKETGECISAQFEVNLSTEDLMNTLESIFVNWKKLKVTVSKQQYDIPRESGIVELTSDVVTFVARK